ncbi:hypothetical protein QYF61_022410 [Mycteria americana]|uniref:Uncharacterized protein n=1 Tax=Mycteria americana TaxID=33587 RepID=A0AAN7RIV9_MYCAM|nr:hypothetical protein QYF61_022410 [Mycteria americana]
MYSNCTPTERESPHPPLLSLSFRHGLYLSIATLQKREPSHPISVIPIRESPIRITRRFFLVAVHGLGSGGPDPLLQGTSGSSLTLRTVNRFCSCKPLGGAGACRLVPEVTSFHPEIVPWGSAFEGFRIYEWWSLFKNHLLKAQEQAIPLCCKVSKQGRRPAWLKRDLLMELKRKIVQSLEAKSGFTRRLQSCGSHMQGEDRKGQSRTRVETGQCCVRQQEGLF